MKLRILEAKYRFLTSLCLFLPQKYYIFHFLWQRTLLQKREDKVLHEKDSHYSCSNLIIHLTKLCRLDSVFVRTKCTHYFLYRKWSIIFRNDAWDNIATSISLFLSSLKDLKFSFIYDIVGIFTVCTIVRSLRWVTKRLDIPHNHTIVSFATKHWRLYYLHKQRSLWFRVRMKSSEHVFHFSFDCMLFNNANSEHISARN